MSEELVDRIMAWLALGLGAFGLLLFASFDWRLGMGTFAFFMAWTIIDLLPMPRR